MSDPDGNRPESGRGGPAGGVRDSPASGATPDGATPDGGAAVGGPGSPNGGGPATLRPEPLALDRRLPLWYQVSQSLRASILGRRPDAPLRLPTEDDLARHYGVSVLTVRQALKPLEDEGLITRHRRRGTFIDPSARPSAPVRLFGSVDAIVAQQSGAEVTVLDRRTGPVPPEVAEYFPNTAETMVFRRLRRQDGEPSNWAENHLLPALGERVKTADLKRWPMTKVLRDRLGVRIGRITNIVQARLADPETARLLQVPLLSPVLHCTGVTYDEDGRVVDVALIRYRGDRFSFSVTLDTGS